MVYTTKNMEIQFATSPVMIAAWPGMGNVGLMAVDYIRRKLGAEEFSSLDMRPFYVPYSIPVKEGRIMPAEIPQGEFHYKRSPALIMFESNAQIEGKDGMYLLNSVMELARKLGVSKIYTVSAYPQPISHTEKPGLFFASNDDDIASLLKLNGMQPLPAGEIPGPAGLLPTIAAAMNIEAACIMATIPLYATGLSYPKSALEIVKSLEDLLDFTIDLSEAESVVETMDGQFDRIEERIRNQFPSMFSFDGEQGRGASMFDEPRGEDDEGDEGMDFAVEEKEQEPEVPAEAFERIEELFERALYDRSVAVDLKRELDRWHLFKKYENRFLDLFKE